LGDDSFIAGAGDFALGLLWRLRWSAIMTVPAQQGPRKQSSGWRTELRHALTQPELARLEHPSDATCRACYHLAVVLGHCRLEDVDLGDLDGSLPAPLALVAAEMLGRLVDGWIRDVENLRDRLNDVRNGEEADELCFGVLEARMEAWAAFVVINEAYQVCAEDRSPEHGRFAPLMDTVLGGIETLDRLMQERIDVLARVAAFPLLENWKRLLGPTSAEVLPWWLDGRIEQRATQLDQEAFASLPARQKGP
jgi:hypothetical protein